MASGIYNRFKANVLNKVVDWEADTIDVALLDNSHAFDADNNVWGDVSANEISGTGYTAGGETLANAAVTQDDTNDRAKADGDNVAWTSATFSAWHAVIFDTTATSNLVCSFDFGGQQQVTAGTFTIQWHTDGIITLS